MVASGEPGAQHHDCVQHTCQASHMHVRAPAAVHDAWMPNGFRAARLRVARECIEG